MGTLCLFLAVALFSYYRFEPKGKVALWKYTLLTPLIISGVYLFYLFGTVQDSFLHNRFFMIGREFRAVIFPTIICGIVIYFSLKKKMKSGINKNYAIVLLLIVIITLVLGIYQNNLENEARKNLEEISSTLDKDFEKRMILKDIEFITQSLKQNLPIFIDDETIFHDVTLDEKNLVVTYFYQSTLDFSLYTKEEIENYKMLWREVLLETASNSKNKKTFVMADISIKFILDDKYDNRVFSIILPVEEYK